MYGGGQPSQNPVGRELCTARPGRAIRPPVAGHGRDGNGRDEGTPDGTAQRGVPPDSVRRIRHRRHPFRIRHGRAHVAGLFLRERDIPNPALDARHDTRLQRPVRDAAGRDAAASTSPTWPTSTPAHSSRHRMRESPIQTVRSPYSAAWTGHRRADATCWSIRRQGKAAGRFRSDATRS